MEVVDLTNLRTMTDGDVEMERELFQEFFTSCESNILQLAHSIRDKNLESWRAHAHAIKGVAYNLGATRLGDLCKHAQENPEQGSAEKLAALEEIQASYQAVKQFLEKVHP